MDDIINKIDLNNRQAASEKNFRQRINVNMITFNGVDYKHNRDSTRLTSQLERIKSVVLNGLWHTLSYISDTANAPESSVSAQLRNLRKERFGSYTVERVYLDHGLYLYRVTGKEKNELQ